MDAIFFFFFFLEPGLNVNQNFLDCCRSVPWSLHQPNREVFNFHTQLDLE